MLYILTVLIAALPLYVNGVRAKVPGSEKCGRLSVAKGPQGSMLATLQHPNSSTFENWQLPPLHDPVLKSITGNRLDLRGFEQIDSAWHLQIWSCRSISTLEVNLLFGNLQGSAQGLTALYLRWWCEVEMLARKDGGKGVVDIAVLADVLAVPIEEIWPFIDWATTTHRCYTILNGVNGMGRLVIFLRAEGQPPQMQNEI
jgi:hypothetical protein